MGAKSLQVARKQIDDLGHDQRVVEEPDDGDDVGDEVDRHQEVPEAEHDRRCGAPRHRKRPVEQQLEQRVDVADQVSGRAEPTATEERAQGGELRRHAVANLLDVLDAYRGDPGREIGKLDECHRFSPARYSYRRRETALVHA
ncbi:MAG TPA: hypothetical protein VIJ22_10840 [Polyangiaceae bacterium]